MHEEIADLVDEHDRVVGSATRSEIRRRKLLHRGIAVVVRNAAGEIYIQRRTESKDVFPGMYSPFVGGMVARGETYDEAARRELEEELGIHGAPLTPVAKILLPDGENPHWVQVYETVWDGEVAADEDEIAWGAFMGEGELRRRMQEWRFSADAREVWRMCFARG